MILTHEAILKAKKEGTIVIEPFDESLVSVNSVDIRLGPDLWHLKKKPIRDLYVPSEDDWEKQTPISVKSIRENASDFAKGVLEDDDLAFVFKSGEFYLATTLESIGTTLPEKREMAFGVVTRPSCLVPEMKAKSTIGRQGLTVALCAGLGDVGYISRWALEIRVTDDGDVPIAIGTPIAQVTFSQATPTELTYNGEDRYQDTGSVRFLPKPLKIVRSNND